MRNARLHLQNGDYRFHLFPSGESHPFTLGVWVKTTSGPVQHVGTQHPRTFPCGFRMLLLYARYITYDTHESHGSLLAFCERVFREAHEGDERDGYV